MRRKVPFCAHWKQTWQDKGLLPSWVSSLPQLATQPPKGSIKGSTGNTPCRRAKGGAAWLTLWQQCGGASAWDLCCPLSEPEISHKQHQSHGLSEHFVWLTLLQGSSLSCLGGTYVLPSTVQRYLLKSEALEMRALAQPTLEGSFHCSKDEMMFLGKGTGKSIQDLSVLLTNFR